MACSAHDPPQNGMGVTFRIPDDAVTPDFSQLRTCKVCSSASLSRIDPNRIFLVHITLCKPDLLLTNDKHDVERSFCDEDLYSDILKSNLDPEVLRSIFVGEGCVLDVSSSWISHLKKGDLCTFFYTITEASSKKAKKKFIGLTRFQRACKLPKLQIALTESRYPAEDTSPSGKQFIPLLLLRRTSLLIRNPTSPRFSYEALRQDLLLVEKWLEFLPLSERHRLFYLKTLCEMKLKLFECAAVSHQKATDYLMCSNLTKDLKKIRADKLARGLKVIEENDAKNIRQPECNSHFPSLAGVNAQFPALSDKVEVKLLPPRSVDEAVLKRTLHACNQGRPSKNLPPLLMKANPGRTIVAQKDIAVGELIAVEEPVAVYPRHDLEYVALAACHHCLRRSDHLLPCRSCRVVMFCSLECLNEAVGTYHQYECKIGLTLMALALGETFAKHVAFPFKIVASKPLSYWVHAISDLRIRSQPNKDTKSFLKGDQYSSEDWRNFWNLEHKSSEEAVVDGPFEAFVYGSATALHGLVLLKMSGYLPHDINETNVADIVIFNILLHCFGTIKYNALDMKWNRPSQKSIMTTSLSAAGVCNTLSFFNHSCSPNAATLTVPGNPEGTTKAKIAIVAVRNVKAGEEVRISYLRGMDFGSMEHTDHSLRVGRLLEAYAFVCDCERCSDNWPSLDVREALQLFGTSQVSVLEHMLEDLSHNKQTLESVLRSFRELYERKSKELSRRLLFEWTSFLTPAILKCYYYSHEAKQQYR